MLFSLKRNLLFSILLFIALFSCASAAEKKIDIQKLKQNPELASGVLAGVRLPQQSRSRLITHLNHDSNLIVEILGRPISAETRSLIISKEFGNFYEKVFSESLHIPESSLTASTKIFRLGSLMYFSAFLPTMLSSSFSVYFLQNHPQANLTQWTLLGIANFVAFSLGTRPLAKKSIRLLSEFKMLNKTTIGIGEFSLNGHLLHEAFLIAMIHAINTKVGVKFLPFEKPKDFRGEYNVESSDFYRFVVQEYDRIVAKRNADTGSVQESSHQQVSENLSQVDYDVVESQNLAFQYRALRESLIRLVKFYEHQPEVKNAILNLVNSLPEHIAEQVAGYDWNQRTKLRVQIRHINNRLSALYQKNAPLGLEKILQSSDKRTIQFLRTHYYALASENFINLLNNLKLDQGDQFQIHIGNIEYLIEPSEFIKMGAALLPVQLTASVGGVEVQKSFVVPFNTETADEDQIIAEGLWVENFTKSLKDAVTFMATDLMLAPDDCVVALGAPVEVASPTTLGQTTASEPVPAIVQVPAGHVQHDWERIRRESVASRQK